MQVIIPVAGYATRLYPLTKNKPKALLDVKGKPILEHILKRIEKLPDITGIYVVSNKKFYPHFSEFIKNRDNKIPTKVLDDGTTSNEDRIGQIGDIQLAIEKYGSGEDLLIISGDNLFNFELGPIRDFFEQKKAIVNALYDIKDFGLASELGVMAIDSESNLVTSFEEKPSEPKSTNVSLGIYFFPKDSVGEIKSYLDSGGKPDKIGYLMAELMKKKKLFGFVYEETWFDIGVLEALERARNEFEP